MAKLTTQQLLDLDYREVENQNTIQKVLRKIKPLSSYPEGQMLPLEAIEKAIKVMDVKYGIGIHYITGDVFAAKAGVIWTAHLHHEGKPTFAMVYGLSMYEVLAKTAIRLYAEVRKERKA